MSEPRLPHDDADEPEREARPGDDAAEAGASGASGASGENEETVEAGQEGEAYAEAVVRDDEGDEGDEASDDDEDDDEDDDLNVDGGHRVVFVSTAIPVQISVAPIQDERAPEGSALGAYIGERLVARCAMPPEAVERLMELDLFSEPVPLALLAVEEEPGLQCRLFALVPAERIADAQHANEPWKASVPSFEDSLADEDDDEDDESGGEGDGYGDEDGDDEDEDDSAVASILLGHIVRFQQDRKFADDLTAEAVDVLQKIVLGGPLEDANAKAVDDFLNSL